MTGTAPPPSKAQQLIRGGRFMLSKSDDNEISEEILATHYEDVNLLFDVKPILHVIEKILQRSTAAVLAVSYTRMEASEDKTYQAASINKFEALSYTIHKISCKISSRHSGGGDAHRTTVALFNTLSSYSWDAKVVLALAAFAVNYGEFWLIAKLYTKHPLAKSVALLEQLPGITEHSDLLKPRFEALRTLIGVMLEVTKSIVEFSELLSPYSPDIPPMSEAWNHFLTAAYWIVKSVVACASKIIGLGRDFRPSTNEAWELSSLAHKVTNIHDQLRKQLHLCHRRREKEAYLMFVRHFEATDTDNMKILKKLIFSEDSKDNLQPWADGSTKSRVIPSPLTFDIEELKGKHVLLLISDLDISIDELLLLEHILFREPRDPATGPQNQYEVVWLPVVDSSIPWTKGKQRQFKHLQSMVPRHSVHPSPLFDPLVIKYIKEKWHFVKKPILVVLDRQGRVVNKNALHMVWIWGNLAFPFTSAREEVLWKNETWKLELLVDGIDPLILNWIEEGRFICLYGGEDMDWIRKFTTKAREVAQAAAIRLEMVYVGKSKPKERVRKNMSIIILEKLSHCWADLTSIWFFWVRLESMWCSKMKQGMSVKDDRIMKEILTMLTFDGSEQGWAVMSRRGSAVMAKAKGDKMLKCLQQLDLWKKQAEQNGFIIALSDHLHQDHTPHQCTRFVLPSMVGRIPETVVCAECGRSMEKYVMYSCSSAYK